MRRTVLVAEVDVGQLLISIKASSEPVSCSDNTIRGTYKVNVFVDGENVRFAQGNATQLTHDPEVRIYPAISGG